MGDAAEQFDLPVPSILKPVEMWTGKQVFSAMVQPNTGTRYVLAVLCGWAVISCAVLCCAVPCRDVLCRAVLCGAVLCCAVPSYAVL